MKVGSEQCVPMSSGSLRSGDEYITPTLEAARIMGLTCPYFVVGGVPTRFKLKTQIWTCWLQDKQSKKSWQVCIPVGCLPPACCPYPVVSAGGGGGVCPGGCLPGGVSAQGVSVHGWCVSQHAMGQTPPTYEQNHR